VQVRRHDRRIRRQRRGLIDTFLAAVAAGAASLLHSEAATSLASHRAVWAAEQARHTGTVVTAA
jgi:hypothetical protein